MHRPEVPPRNPAARFLADRRERLERVLGWRLRPPAGAPAPAERRRFLLEEAEDLYWNELSWEELTGDARIGGVRLVEHIFPGFLALVDGLLVREAPPASPVRATPRPDVVEAILRFLAERCTALHGAEEPADREALAVTLRLVDLVLYRLHRLPVEGGERPESARHE